MDDSSTDYDRERRAYFWLLIKHQIRLSTGLLKSEYERGTNFLLAPNALISSLCTLLPGSKTKELVDFAQMILNTQCDSRYLAIKCVRYHCEANKNNLKTNANSLHVNNFHYSHPR